MTKLLKTAFKKASELSEMQQNQFASWLIDELESDNKWDTYFANSQDTLNDLSKEALKEHQSNLPKKPQPQKMQVFRNGFGKDTTATESQEKAAIANSKDALISPTKK